MNFKDILKLISAFIAVIVVIMITIISMGLFDLQWSEFYKPRKENIKREVFENTQSYVHGKTQALSKYYFEYQNSNDEIEKTAIASMVRMQFSEFNADQLNSPQLRGFLSQIRGY
jgi:hypothetical protein